jgi:phage gp36-like protein
LEARFGVGELQQLEIMQTVGNSIEEALQDASEEIDSYIAVKYVLPLPSNPAAEFRFG